MTGCSRVAPVELASSFPVAAKPGSFKEASVEPISIEYGAPSTPVEPGSFK